MIGKGNVRIGFERAILESNFSAFRRLILKSYNKIVKGPVPRGTKRKEVIRARFGNNFDGTAENNIKRMLAHAGIEFSEIKQHAPGVVRDGKDLGSNDYFTYEITSDEFKTVWITNSTVDLDDGSESLIGKKELTPSAVGVEGTTYKSEQNLIKDIISGLSTIKSIDDNVRKNLINICESINKNVNVSHNTMTDFYDDSSVKIKIPITEVEPAFKLDGRSTRNLVNDFGEILDGLYLLNTIKNKGTGMIFPSAANESLSDIWFDGYNISSKASKGGGRPGIGALVGVISNSATEGNKFKSDNKKEVELHDMLLAIRNEAFISGRLDTVMTYLTVAKRLDSKLLKGGGLEYLLEVSGLKLDAITNRSQIVSFLRNLAEKSSEDFDNFIYEFWKKANIKPKIKPDSKLFLEKENASLVYYPIAVELTRILNAEYRPELSVLINKFLVVKQLYFNISFESGIITIESKSSKSSSNSKFMARGSANLFNAGLGYEMK